jgi:chloramphenicol 3-O-phosphotransferase
VLIVICGPIASGKSALARAVAHELEQGGTPAAAVDLDLLYAMLDHQGRAWDDERKWTRARRAAAALADRFLADGIAVVLEGDLITGDGRRDFVSALRSAIEPQFVTLRVSFESALARAQSDPTRGLSRDPGFLRWHYDATAAAFQALPKSDLVLDTGRIDVANAARAFIAWSSGSSEAYAETTED